MKADTNSGPSNIVAFIAGVLALFIGAGAFAAGQAGRDQRQGSVVHIAGVVTYRDPDRGLLFVQDAAGGVAVELKNADPGILAGQQVQVDGVISPGNLNPIITNAKVTSFGPARFPMARSITRWSLVTGMEEAQWVEIPGVIQSVTVSNGVASLDIASGKAPFSAKLQLRNDGEAEMLAKFVDATARFRGVASAHFNTAGQFAGVNLYIPGIEHVIIEKTAPEPSALQPIPARKLSSYLPVTGNMHRVKVRGVVNWQRLGRALSVQDETDGTGVYVQTTQKLPVQPGDRIEVIGFPDRVLFSPYLRGATFEKTGSGKTVKPVEVTADELVKGARDYQLVTIEGELTGRIFQKGDLILNVRSGTQQFSAYLDERKADKLNKLQPGSQVKLTGVCWVLIDEQRLPRYFRIMLRGADDVVTVRAPGWWSFERTMFLLGVMTFVLIVALVWAITLRRAVRDRASQLQKGVEREVAFAALGHKLSVAATPADAARVILATADGLFAWDASAIRLYDVEKNRGESILDVDTINGKRCEVTSPGPYEASPMLVRVFNEGAQLVLRKRAETASETIPFGDETRRSASLMFVPLRDGTKHIGMLSLQSYTHDAYTNDDLKLLQQLADHCGAALQRIWAQELVRKTNAELEQRVERRTAELAEANRRLQEEIDSHKRTEATLFKEQQLFQNFMETAPDSIYFKDCNGRFIRVNKEKLKRFGVRDASQILGKTDFDFFTQEDARAMQVDELEILRTGEPIIAKEERVSRFDGSTAWVLTTKMPLRNETGEIIGTFGITRDITAHKKAEQSLVYGQHLLETIMNHVPDYMYFKDLEGHFVRVNTAFANQFGNCEPHEMIGKTDFDFLTPEAAQASFDDEQKVIKTGEPVLGKEEHEIWLDGHEWWVLTSKMPFRDESGKVIGTFGVTRDITQRKRAEEALKQVQQDLENRVQERTSELMRTNERLLEEIGDRIEAELRTAMFSNLGYWLSSATQAEEAAKTILDVADQLLGWDSAYLHLFTGEPKRVIPIITYDLIAGKREILRGDRGGELISDRDRKIIDHGAELVLRHAPQLSEEMIPFGSGKPSLSLMFVPIRNGAKVIGALSIQSYSADVYTDKDLKTLQALADFCSGTLERIQAAQALRNSQEHFSKAFMSSPVPMTLSLLRSGKYFDVNDAMLRLTGFSRDEMIGRTSLELGIWPHPESRQKMVDAVIANRSVRDMEFELRTKAGQLRKTLLSVEMMDFGGEPTILVSVYDATERFNLEERLRQSQKMEAVGQLAAGVAHDFNNILTIIQGHTTLLLETEGIDESARESLAQVNDAAERAANLTRQLLAFSRKQRMQPRALDLNEIVGTTSKMLQRILGENISLHFNYSPGLPPICADSGMLEQVLINLALNARDAMQSGGHLTIATEVTTIDDAYASGRPAAQSGTFVRLTGTDTGCGMTEGTLGRIFEPFFTTKEVGKGTGLGLATVYGIVKQHRGWIEAESAISKGSAFKIYLPISETRVTTSRDLAKTATASGGNETVLLVEDEPALRVLVRNILEVYGYKVLEASHGREALGVWEQHRDKIDLLLTDIVMPEGISGIELADLLKKDEPKLRVIYTSGYSVELFKEKHRLIEGQNFLAKPYQPRILASTIRSCLET